MSGAGVLIAGGAGAVGMALARRYLADGAKVALLDADPTRLAAAAQALSAGDATIAQFPCDLCDAAATARAVEDASAFLGRVDVAVMCAGLTHVSPAVQTQTDVLRRVMEINFFGAVHFAGPAIPALRATRGALVLLSSVAGFAPLLGRAGYCASKHALHGYCDTLRAELRADGVHVLLVCPSFIDSDFARRGLDGGGAQLRFERTTTGRALLPGEVAAAIHRAVRARRDLLLLGTAGRASWWIWHLCPWLYERIMRRRFTADVRRP